MKRLHAAALLLLLVAFGFLVTVRPAAADKDAAWGTVKGQVVLDAPAAPEPKEINVDKDKEHCLSKGKIYDESLVVNKQNQGVRYAIVWLAPMAKNGQLPVHPHLQAVKDKTVELDQPCCMFSPRVLAMREGQELVAKNSSPIAHNINWVGIKNPGGNVLIPSKQEYKITDLVVDKVPLKLACNIHPWMAGYVKVFDHPYFAVTDENGKFEIKSAPAGNFRLVVWQERVGYVPNRDGTVVTIKGDGTTEAEVKMKPPTEDK